MADVKFNNMSSKLAIIITVAIILYTLMLLVLTPVSILSQTTGSLYDTYYSNTTCFQHDAQQDFEDWKFSQIKFEINLSDNTLRLYDYGNIWNKNTYIETPTANSTFDRETVLLELDGETVIYNFTVHVSTIRNVETVYASGYINDTFVEGSRDIITYVVKEEYWFIVVDESIWHSQWLINSSNVSDFTRFTHCPSPAIGQGKNYPVMLNYYDEFGNIIRSELWEGA